MAAMAYDGGTHELFMFGGFAQSGLLKDTWVWDGKGWTPGKPTVFLGTPANEGYPIS